MAGTKPYPQELRERAVRMVAEVRPNYESDWAAITAVAARLGIGTAETLRKWVRQAQVDDGRRSGVTSEESAELKRLRREHPVPCGDATKPCWLTSARFETTADTSHAGSDAPDHFGVRWEVTPDSSPTSPQAEAFRSARPR